METENQEQGRDIGYIKRQMFSNFEKVKKDSDERKYYYRIKRNQ